jgi:hypothetical protein
MDNTDHPPQEPINNLPSQPSSPVVEPQQTIVSSTLPPAKSKKSLVVTVLIISLLIIFIGGAVTWFVFGKKEKQNSTPKQTTESSQASQVTENSGKCAYIPKQNYKENEGLYGTWRENAKKVDFDVYLPCKFHKDFNLYELGIAGGDSDEVVNVFLTFNRPDPESGEDGLPDDSNFYIRALPAQHQPPSKCIDMFSITSKNIKTGTCQKAGDSKFGPVYKNDQGDLYITINNSLIIWSYQPYNDSGDVKPMLDIIDSLQKVDPSKLEFFIG